MKSLAYEHAHSVDDASNAAASGAALLAGGTDLIPRLKLGLATPDRLVDLKAGHLPTGISIEDGRLVIGALATLADVSSSEIVAEHATALAEAAQSAATVQIRNRATVAGNLLQEPRCSYYRNVDVDCWRKGGTGCPAETGRNEHHAIFDSGPCRAVHPSDIATALVALGASVDIASSSGERTVSISELLAPPTEDRRSEHTLHAGEVIVGLTMPIHPGRGSAYIKEMDRATWAFALVGVAATIDVVDRTSEIRIAAGGVASTPIRLAEIEERLRSSAGDDWSPSMFRVTNAEPLTENGYKVPLLHAATQRAAERGRARSQNRGAQDFSR